MLAMRIEQGIKTVDRRLVAAMRKQPNRYIVKNVDGYQAAFFLGVDGKKKSIRVKAI